jgi:hypothetical protein
LVLPSSISHLPGSQRLNPIPIHEYHVLESIPYSKSLDHVRAQITVTKSIELLTIQVPIEYAINVFLVILHTSWLVLSSSSEEVVPMELYLKHLLSVPHCFTSNTVQAVTVPNIFKVGQGKTSEKT